MRIDGTRGANYTVRMSMGKRKRKRQPTMWVATTELLTAASHPFYRRLNQLLRERGFDDFVEAQCAGFYAETMGRPSLAPGVYFRLLERPCAHLYETGALRRAYVRGHENVLKRLLVHASAFNLGLWMRRLFGIGTPRALQGRLEAVRAMLGILWSRISEAITSIWDRSFVARRARMLLERVVSYA
jgi:hypothetical protein